MGRITSITVKTGDHVKKGQLVATISDEDIKAKRAQTAAVISEAEAAYASSQKDYERFNIKDSKNSLNNASLKSNGAVPEPHEWALIIIVCFVLLYIKFRPVKKHVVR